jgi:hypothetical protein
LHSRERHDPIEARIDEAVEACGRSSAPRVPRGGDALAPPHEWRRLRRLRHWPPPPTRWAVAGGAGGAGSGGLASGSAQGLAAACTAAIGASRRRRDACGAAERAATVANIECRA